MDAFTGEIRAVGFNFTARDWTGCNGQIISISQNQALFALLGTYYGGDGRSSFGIPELRGRTPIGMGAGPGLPDFPIGEKVGASSHQLAVNNLPTSLQQDIYGNAQIPAGVEVSGEVDTGGRDPSPLLNGQTSENKALSVNLSQQPGQATGTGVTVLSSFTGAPGQPISNYQPSLAINFMMLLDGIFPPRN